MDYRNVFISTILLSLMFFSCSDRKVKDANINNDVKFVVKDSFNISSNNLISQDFRKGNLLFFNRPSNDIITYNIITKEESNFNKLGKSNEEYKYIYPKSLRFVNDSVIGISSINNIKKYSRNGEYLGTLKLKNENTYAPLYNYLVYKDSILISILSPQGNPSNREFYKKKPLFLKANLYSKEQSSHFNFPLHGSDLSNKEYYFPYIYDNHEIVNLESNIYSFINSNDSNLYSFSFPLMDTIYRKRLTLEHYNPLKIPFGKQIGNYDNLINNFVNSMILNYLKYEDNEYILYTEGIERNEVIEFAKNNEGFPNLERPDRKVWMQYLFKGEKKHSDFLFSKKYGFPIISIGHNKFITQLPNNEKNDIEGNTTFYEVEIQFQ